MDYEGCDFPLAPHSYGSSFLCQRIVACFQPPGCPMPGQSLGDQFISEVRIFR
jgi:hypothetical protein